MTRTIRYTTALGAAIAATLTIGQGVAAAEPNTAAFERDLAAAGIPKEKTKLGVSPYVILETWAGFACEFAPRLGVTDSRVVDRLPGDIASTGVELTPAQAAAVWSSAKQNICGRGTHPASG